MSSFDPFQSLTTYLEVPDQIHTQFNSLSSPIYESTVSKTHKSIFFESMMFAYIEHIHRTKDLVKFKKFQILFEDCLPNIQQRLFPEKSNVKKLTNYANFDDLTTDLLHNLRSYEYLFAAKTHAQLSIYDLSRTKKSSQARFHLVLKFLLLDTLSHLMESNKEFSEFYQLILDEKFDEGGSFINTLTAYILDTNLKIYSYETPKPTVEYYKRGKKTNTNENEIDLLRDKKGFLRILNNHCESTNEEKDKIIQKYEAEKTGLMEQIASYQINQRNLEREVNLLRELYSNSFQMSTNLAQGCQNYVKILLKSPSALENVSFKFSTRRKLRKNMKNIRNYEKVIRKKGFAHLDNRKGLDEIDEILEKMQENLSKFYDHITEITKPSVLKDKKDLTDSENEFEEEVFPLPKKQQILVEIPKNSEFDPGKLLDSKQTFILCPVCETRVPINEIRTFDCDCKICVDCLKNFLQSRYNQAKYELDIPCFNDKCKSKNPGVFPPVSINLVLETLGKEILEKMEMFLVSRYANKKCSNENCPFSFHLEEDQSFMQNFVICPECNQDTCVRCWKKNHPKKQCTLIDQSIRIAYANKKIRICPNCHEPATKDDHCDRVNCCKCGLEFCFGCSVIRAPTIRHGNHYHRKDCPFYNPYVDQNGNDIYDDKIEKQCPECVKAGKLCERPKMTTEEFYKHLKIDQFIIDSLKANQDDV